MAFGDITVTLRPIKFAFLVNPLERKQLDRVIRTSLFLWGGLHNPIIPVYRRLPRYWSDFPSRRLSPSEVCKGYIRTFDPDAVVICGDVDKSIVPANVEHIVTLDELTGDLTKEDAPALGVGLFEVFGSFARDEFRYVRQDGMKVLMPAFAGPGSMLFRSVFGDIPTEARRETYGALLKLIKTNQPRVNLGNFLQIIREESFFLSSLCTHGLEFRRPRGETAVAVFLMKHDNLLDLVDFWNLRALGWHVLPIPVDLSALDDTRDYVRRFIERHSTSDQNSAGLTGPRLLKARSVPETEFMAFVNSIPRASVKSLTVQVWYPPMWDEFTRRGGRLTCSSISASQAQTQVSDESSVVRIKALAPEFMAPNLGHGARYANDIRISMYGRSDFGAEVLPPYEKSVSQLFGIGLWQDWRIGPGGPTFLGRHSDWTIQLNQPRPRDVIALTLADRGWQGFEFSPSGNVAYQMMRHLGGPHQIRHIRNFKLVQFLESLAAGRNISEEGRIKKRLQAKFKQAGDTTKKITIVDATQLALEEVQRALRSPHLGRDVLVEDFRVQMNVIANSMLVPPNIDELIGQYTKSRIFNLGVQVQCSVCGQRSWHPVDSMKYELECSVCLSAFGIPIHNPHEIKWSYKSLGPFAIPKQGYGAYSVLLAVYFLSSHHHPATTPVLSFRVKRAGQEIEADFMMFYRDSVFWERETEIIFGECKSFNAFQEKDVERMGIVAADNPGAILVFATLSSEFSAREKQILAPFIRVCRKHSGLERPKNPVLLLTGIELFSTLGPPQCWRDAGGAMKTFAEAGFPSHSLLQLCDATQQLHLGMPPWANEWAVDFEKRRARRNKPPGSKQ
jgi:hypothetical protein